ncbi:MAG: hypothetical protein LBE22_09825 [Azoarcus sp.]|jgi:hypothetical protein|nr:hypothetical protein [Azoarcus sp.]
MNDDETNLKNLLVMQQAQMNVLMSVCGTLLAHRLDWQHILDGLTKYNAQVIDQDKPEAYVAGVASVIKALRNSVEIMRMTRPLPDASPPPSVLH